VYGKLPPALALDVFEGRDRGAGDRADGPEHARVVGIEKGLSGRAGDDGPQFIRGCNGEQTPQLTGMACARKAAAAQDGGQKSAGIAAPFTRCRILSVRDQAPRQLFDIETVFNLGEPIPSSRNRQMELVRRD